jgi:hypothetical protein
LARSDDHIFDNVVLGVQNNISQFSEILDHILILEVTLDDDRAALRIFKVRKFDKFFDYGIQDPIELFAL